MEFFFFFFFFYPGLIFFFFGAVCFANLMLSKVTSFIQILSEFFRAHFNYQFQHTLISPLPHKLAISCFPEQTEYF